MTTDPAFPRRPPLEPFGSGSLSSKLRLFQHLPTTALFVRGMVKQ